MPSEMQSNDGEGLFHLIDFGTGQEGGSILKAQKLATGPASALVKEHSRQIDFPCRLLDGRIFVGVYLGCFYAE